MEGHKALQEAKIDGSTTVVLAALDTENKTECGSVKMNTVNLGDSAYMIIRPESSDSSSSTPGVTKLFRSVEAQHYFNCPFQTGWRYSPPKRAKENSHAVRHNDIVVLATDGVTDNLFDEEIISDCIKPYLRPDGELPGVKEAALCISAKAECTSYSKVVETPWTRAAVAAGYKREEEIGGKEDDITVIVAQVKTQ